MRASLYARPVTASEQKQLTIIASSPSNGRDMRKALAIQWSLCGQHSKDIGEHLNVCRSTVRRWIRKFNAGGITTIATRKSPGRPLLADEQFFETTKDTLAKNPQDCGYDATVWSAELLRKHLHIVTGTNISQRTMYNVLHRLDYVFKRPKLDLKHKQDPAKVACAKRAKTISKKKVDAAPDRIAFAYLDEAEFHLNPQLTRMWILRGKQALIPSAGRNRRIAAFGALDHTTRQLSVMVTEKKRSHEFMQFLSWLLGDVYKGYDHVYLFMDNCSIHKTKLVNDNYTSRLMTITLPCR